MSDSLTVIILEAYMTKQIDSVVICIHIRIRNHYGYSGNGIANADGNQLYNIIWSSTSLGSG